MINITKTYLPPIEKYNKYLKKIWDSCHLTNDGPLVKELEDKLKKRFKVKHVYFTTNGTTALQIAIKSFGLKKEIITTPFSYVATTSSIVWENCKPVFVDIDPETLNVDPLKIEKAINKNTEAILVTHVFGNPCNIEKINKIAKKYKLKIIYDAAHAFDVEYKGKPLVNFGDISIVSFHATKIFHTVEGGAIITNNKDLAKKVLYLKNFGHKGQEDFECIGINGKNSEFHAAMGLCVLPKIKQIIKARKKLSEMYDQIFSKYDKKIKKQKISKNTKYNYHYYPIILQDEKTLIKIKNKLNNENIFPRRYFYPSLDTLNYVKTSPMIIARDISKRILCLPLYSDLSKKDVKRISKIIINIIKE